MRPIWTCAATAEGRLDGETTAPLEGEGLGPAHLAMLDRIGEGGMGEVWRARDLRLDCLVALKAIKPSLAHSAEMRARFCREAALTAGLQHPGIVSVHEIGALADGRPYYTMTLVEGQPMGELIRAHHDAVSRGQAPPTSLRQLLGVLQRCCEAVGFAHARGVVHRDLKPDNLRVGSHGELIVLDWGLAEEAGPLPEVAAGPIGTRGYIAPELLGGAPASPASDVFALGVLLHEILWGRRPAPSGSYPSSTAEDGLAAICLRALAADPAERFPEAGALGEEIRRWLDGARRRERALALVEEADALAQKVAHLRQEGTEARAEATALAAAIPAWEPVSEKRALWALEDRADQAERAADLSELQWIQLLHASLTHAPDLPEAHARLARHYRQQHADAEAARDERAAARWELLTRQHDRGEHRAWLSGEGRLTLRTTPPGASVRLFRYEAQERRCVPVLTDDLGPTPLVERTIPRGSYLLEITAPGRPPVHHPIGIGRGEDADCALILLQPGELGPEERWVTPGWALIGGDPLAANAAPAQRMRFDGFVMRRYPVTNTEYLAFLNDLVAQGRAEEAQRYAPRERAAMEGSPARRLYGFESGQFLLTEDTEGDLWQPDWPVMMVDWCSALACAAWLAERDGLPWRLPREDEWERAARGADGRYFPWGDLADPTFACYRLSHRDGERAGPRPVSDFPLDESPFGIRGMGGGVRDWCHNVWGGDRKIYQTYPVVRGGAWNAHPQLVRAATRGWATEGDRSANIGFRLVRSL